MTLQKKPEALLANYIQRIGSWDLGHCRYLADEMIANPDELITHLVSANILTPVTMADYRDSSGQQRAAYFVVKSKCNAWIECGHGRQVCSHSAGHAGFHRSPIGDDGTQFGSSVLWDEGES